MYPKLGDKFAYNGCKCTIAAILPDVRMPTFSDGTYPDMIFNFHSLATRRNLSILYAGLITYYGVHKVKIIDGTPF